MISWKIHLRWRWPKGLYQVKPSFFKTNLYYVQGFKPDKNHTHEELETVKSRDNIFESSSLFQSTVLTLLAWRVAFGSQPTAAWLMRWVVEVVKFVPNCSSYSSSSLFYLFLWLQNLVIYSHLSINLKIPIEMDKPKSGHSYWKFLVPQMPHSHWSIFECFKPYKKSKFASLKGNCQKQSWSSLDQPPWRPSCDN